MKSTKLAPLILGKSALPPAEAPNAEPILKENQQSHLNIERTPPRPTDSVYNRGLADRRAPQDRFPVAMVEHSPEKRSGAFIHLEVDNEDLVPENQELENKEDVAKLAAAHVKAPVQLTAPNYAESIMTSKFYLVNKPITPEQVDQVEESVEPQKYETAAEAYKGVMGSYTLTMGRFQVLALLFLSGLLAGAAVLHFFVLFWSSDLQQFLQMYAKVAKDGLSVFYMLSYLCAIFSLFLALEYVSKYRLAAANVEHEEAGAHIIHAVLYWAGVARKAILKS